MTSLHCGCMASLHTVLPQFSVDFLGLLQDPLSSLWKLDGVLHHIWYLAPHFPSRLSQAADTALCSFTWHPGWLSLGLPSWEHIPKVPMLQTWLFGYLENMFQALQFQLSPQEYSALCHWEPTSTGRPKTKSQHGKHPKNLKSKRHQEEQYMGLHQAEHQMQWLPLLHFSTRRERKKRVLCRAFTATLEQSAQHTGLLDMWRSS